MKKIILKNEPNKTHERTGRKGKAWSGNQAGQGIQRNNETIKYSGFQPMISMAECILNKPLFNGSARLISY